MEQKIDIEDSVRGIWEKLDVWLDSIILSLPNFVLAIIVFLLFILASKYVAKSISALLRRKGSQDSIRHITAQVAKVIVISIGFFVALSLLNLDKVVTSVLAGAGVVGLAIGLALQGTLTNTFSGVILSFLPQLQIGDWVETNDFAGEVMDISLRNVIIKGADNNYVVIPNSKIVDSPFKNFSRTARSRIILDVGVSYSSDLEFVESLTKDTIEKNFPQRGNEEVELMYNAFAESSINFVVRFWVDATKNKDVLNARSKAIIAIKKIYDEHGINIPFPIRTIEFNNRLSLNKTEEGNS